VLQKTSALPESYHTQDDRQRVSEHAE